MLNREKCKFCSECEWSIEDRDKEYSLICLIDWSKHYISDWCEDGYFEKLD